MAAPRYTLSELADQRISEIYRYSIETFGEQRADAYFLSLHDTFETLARNPEMGRPFYEYRRHEHRSHVIFYKAVRSGVLIVQVLHQREEAESRFE